MSTRSQRLDLVQTRRRLAHSSLRWMLLCWVLTFVLQFGDFTGFTHYALWFLAGFSFSAWLTEAYYAVRVDNLLNTGLGRAITYTGEGSCSAQHSQQ